MLSLSSVAQAFDITERPEEDLLLLAIDVEGTLLDEAMATYLPTGESYDELLIPLGYLARRLGFALTVTPEDGIAQGWLYTESNIFALDISRGELTRGGHTKALPDNVVEVHSDDIYVRLGTLVIWFQMAYNLDLPSYTLQLSAERNLPFQDKALRQDRANALDRLGGRGDVYDENTLLVPYQKFSPPVLLLQGGSFVSHSNSETNMTGSYSVQGKGDLFHFGSVFTLSGNFSDDTSPEITQSELTFRRQDPGSNMLGPLRAGRIEFGDVNFPDAGLLVGRNRGRGIAVSSNPQLGLSVARNPDDFVIDGEGPINWDVELYRNGAFIDFQIIGNDGRYTFNEVPLSNGYNIFRIVLYGPEGQTIEREQRVLRGPKMLKRGAFEYDAGMGQPRADFIPLSEDKRTDGTVGGSVQALYGVTDFLTLGGGVYRGPFEETDVTAIPLSAALSFLGLNTELEYTFATGGRQVAEIEAQTRVLGATVAASHQASTGFKEDEREIKDVSELRLSRSFGKLNTDFAGRFENFRGNKTDRYTLENRLSTSMLGFNFTNTLAARFLKGDTGNPDWDGEFLMRKGWGSYNVQTALLYELESSDPIRTIRATLRRYFADGMSIRLTGEHQVASHQTSLQSRLTRDFGPFSVDLDLSGDSEDNYSAGVNFRTALMPTPLADRDATRWPYQLTHRRDGNTANLNVLSYLDINDNGVYDAGEPPVEGVTLRSSRGNKRGTSDATGMAQIRGLGESPTSIAAELETIPDIYLKPQEESLRLIPRIGSDAVVTYAFTKQGEIEGTVYKIFPDDTRTEFGGALVQLQDETGTVIQEERAEYDGYYLFTNLPMGSYRVSVAPKDTYTMDDRGQKTATLTIDEPLVLGADLFVMDERPQTGVPDEVTEQVMPRGLDYWVHIGSLRTPALAEKEWHRLMKRHPTILSARNMELRLYKIDFPWTGVFYRVLGGPLKKQDAATLCRDLIALNNPGGCLVVGE